MNSAPSQTIWLWSLGFLAAEVAILALLLEVARRRIESAAWRRTLCQTALLALFALTACELSGLGRFAAGRVEQVIDWRGALVGTSGQTASTSKTERGSERALAMPPRRSNAGGVGGRTSESLPTPSTIGESAPQVLPRRVRLSTPWSCSKAEGAAAWWWFGLAWGLGVLVGGRACIGRCLVAAYGLWRGQTADLVLRERVNQWARALGLRRRVRVIQSARATSPMAYGWFWPSVALPHDFQTRLDRARQDAVIIHEAAHLAGRDPLWGLLADVAAALLWWHPAAWWIRRQLHLASELAADEASLLVADGPRVLAQCLVELGAQMVQRPPIGHLRMAGFRSHLGQRVHRLLRIEGRSWSQPRPLRGVAVRFFGTTAVVAAVILSTTWASPQALTKGETMNTIKQNWKHSLAAFALMAAVGGPDTARAAEPPDQTIAVSDPASQRMGQRYGLGAETSSKTASATNAPGAFPAGASAPQASAAALARDGKLLYEMGKLGEAEAKFKQALKEDPESPVAPYYLDLLREGPLNKVRKSPRADQIEAKLKSMVMPAVGPWGHLPLGEVIKILIEQSRNLSPDKQGVNFMFDLSNLQPPRGIEAATGLPATAPESIDLSQIGILIDPPLKNVTLMDLLDIIVKTAERPIQYSIEDYAVVFAPKWEAKVSEKDLHVSTFKVEQQALLDGLENAFGIKTGPLAQDPAARSRQFQAALKGFLAVLGISSEGGRSIFFNEGTGVVMVRASQDELEVIRAAMVTLGGADMGLLAKYRGSGGGAGSGVAGGTSPGAGGAGGGGGAGGK